MVYRLFVYKFSCSNEEEQFSEPDECFENYQYDVEKNSCVFDSTKANPARNCNKFQHYVQHSESCEPNFFHCPYGNVTDTCHEYNSHSFMLFECRLDCTMVKGKDVF